MLADARYVASGLMPCDDGPAVAAFVDLMKTLLTEYSPSQLDERSLGEALIIKVESRSDVFTESQIKGITEAYEESFERGLLFQGLDDGASDPDGVLEPLWDDESVEGDIGGAEPWSFG
mmetsp:Transcript_18943/g.41350  ORF Transcript_18943/g.41350 Transcript_18943/m.41350 type:complete len:119 (+) Transcript_18943:2-358(+)